MTLEQAKQNLDNLIAMSRLMRQEHSVLVESLQTLYKATKEKQEDKEEKRPL
jgi:hypothetical protein